MRPSGFAFEDLMMRGTFEDLSDQVFTEMTDLNLGRWTCLENSWSGGSEKCPSSVISKQSTTGARKRLKSSSTIPRCKVEGCNLDLSGAKDYHQKNGVCDIHSKSSLVIVKGLERRFCQQCSRFHALSEFDENKRSCRKRLAVHNARRHKKRQERLEFNPSRLPLPSCYGQQVNHNPVYYPISMHGNPSNGFLAPNVTATSGILAAQGLKDVSSASDFDRALYLLSSNYWGSSEQVSLMSMPQTMMHALPQPQSSEYWLLEGQPSTFPRGIGTDFYFSPLHYY